jgi:hypothetical protein
MVDVDFSPPEGLSLPLWRSLLINVLERLSPERLPPLQLTSKPVDVGILVGDLVDLPWYRTVFTNLGDVISPETLPPLELTSRPVDVGELLGDELSHGWWDSLMTSIREKLSPERLPAPQLTAQPVPAFGADSTLQILDWSALINTPKVFMKDIPVETTTVGGFSPVATALAPAPVDSDLLMTRMQLTRDIGRTHFRRRLWIGLAGAEAIFLLVALFKLQ